MYDNIKKQMTIILFVTYVNKDFIKKKYMYMINYL